MSEHLKSQGSALVKGVNAFEPYMYRLHEDFRAEKFIDWPTVVLINTTQATAISMFRLLPTQEYSSEVLDKRSIASLVRNIVETHDVLRMMVNVESVERFNLNRDILGLYISSRMNKVQKQVSVAETEEIYAHTKERYWEKIKRSPLYTESMRRIKDGESIFYCSRRKRVEEVCGENSGFVLGILTDLSAYVHSIPPPLWFGNLEELYADNQANRDSIAVWLRVANFYIAKSYEIVLSLAEYTRSEGLTQYLEHHREVFN